MAVWQGLRFNSRNDYTVLGFPRTVHYSCHCRVQTVRRNIIIKLINCSLFGQYSLWSVTQRTEMYHNALELCFLRAVVAQLGVKYRTTCRLIYTPLGGLQSVATLVTKDSTYFEKGCRKFKNLKCLNLRSIYVLLEKKAEKCDGPATSLCLGLAITSFINGLCWWRMKWVVLSKTFMRFSCRLIKV